MLAPNLETALYDVAAYRAARAENKEMYNGQRARYGVLRAEQQKSLDKECSDKGPDSNKHRGKKCDDALSFPRDNVVIHEGTLKTLKRVKDEVKEVREGFECGMAFENYDDIKENDVIECFEMEEIARSLWGACGSLPFESQRSTNPLVCF